MATRPNREMDDMDQRFAPFGLRPLPDEEVWALAMAGVVMPTGAPGAALYLTHVAGVDCFTAELRQWGEVVAAGIASGRYKARGGHYRRAYVESYPGTWGAFAVADGLSLAMFGNAPGLNDRTAALKCGAQAYQRIRDFVGGCAVTAMAEYRCALEWALGYRRDRVFEGRWEGVTGQNWDEARRDAKLGYHRSAYPLFAPGCGRIVPLKDQADSFEDQPETLYPALRPSGCWDDGYARRMKRECPVTIIYAPPRK